MKIVLPKIMIVVLSCAFAGCGQSAQEKLAQQQLEQLEKQKKMVAGFEALAKKRLMTPTVKRAGKKPAVSSSSAS